MTKLEYTVSFATPAFLGNADQQAQWRTPPFKAMIRQWWRVVKAPHFSYDVIELRKEEARLFGSASDTESSRSGKSRIAVRLSSWRHGVMDQWQSTERVHHPEVSREPLRQLNERRPEKEGIKTASPLSSSPHWALS